MSCHVSVWLRDPETGEPCMVRPGKVHGQGGGLPLLDAGAATIYFASIEQAQAVVYALMAAIQLCAPVPAGKDAGDEGKGGGLGDGSVELLVEKPKS